jgi:RIO1 family
LPSTAAESGFDDDEPTFAKRQRHSPSLPAPDAFDSVDGLPEGNRWSTWDQPSAGERGPRPYPDWLITELVHHGRLIIIDLPQVVDVIANPRGAEFLDRDATNIARWFSAHGLDSTTPGPRDLPALLRSEARIR